MHVSSIKAVGKVIHDRISSLPAFGNSLGTEKILSPGFSKSVSNVPEK